MGSYWEIDRDSQNRVQESISVKIGQFIIMFYQIIQISFAGLLLMVQILFLYLIRKKQKTST
jgi:hypothetical protein